MSERITNPKLLELAKAKLGDYYIASSGKDNRREINALIEDAPSYEQLYVALAAYEDAEESGLLVRLPCKVGDTVYIVYDGEIRNVIVTEIKNKLGRVLSINNLMSLNWNAAEVFRYNWKISYKGHRINGVHDFSNIGEHIFLTREDAEQALRERSENEV